MATTNLGVYYPGANDNVDWPAIFSTIASSVDNLLTELTFDSGWVPILEFHDNWRTRFTSLTGRVQIRRVGKICRMSGMFEAAAPPAVRQIFTLPTGFENDRGYNYSVSRITTGTARVELDAISKTLFFRNSLSGVGSDYFGLGNIAFVAG